MPSVLPNSLVATQTTSSQVNVDVEAGSVPFSICASISLARFALGSESGEYKAE
jgi:hypothetical protein